MLGMFVDGRPHHRHVIARQRQPSQHAIVPEPLSGNIAVRELNSEIGYYALLPIIMAMHSDAGRSAHPGIGAIRRDNEASSKKAAIRELKPGLVSRKLQSAAVDV